MSFSVEDFHDLLRLLEARPEWRAELRLVVLTEDLLRLPEQLAQARLETERSFQELAARLDTLTARVDGLATRVDSLITQVSTLAGHVGTLRGESLEHRYRTRVFAYFGRVLRRAHVLSPDELSTMLEDAIQGVVLSVEDAHEIALADVVVRGTRPTDGSTVYLVLEFSVGVGLDDVQRALSRAELLARTGVTAVAAVAGEWVVPDAADAARALRVWQITDGRVVAPDAPRAGGTA